MTKFFSFFIRSNIYISLAATLLYFYYALLLEKNFFLSTPLLVFSLTFMGYHFVRFFPAIKGDPHSKFYKDWYEDHRFFLLISMAIAITVMIFGVLDLATWQLAMLGGASLLTLLYEKVIFKGFSLRSLPFAKPFVIALAWSLSCVGLHSKEIITDYLSFLDCFFLIFILCFVFDLQDKEVDKLQGVKTFAHTLSLKTVMLISFFFFILYLVFSYFLVNPMEWIALLVIQLFFLAAGLKLINRKILFHYLIDGIIILKCLGFIIIQFQ